MIEPKPARISPVLRANLLLLAERFAALGGFSLSTVGRRFHGDHSFFADLRAETPRGAARAAPSEGATARDEGAQGRRPVGFTNRKYDDLVAQFAREWPEGAEFPALADPKHYPGRAPATPPKPTARARRPATTTRSESNGEATSEGAQGRRPRKAQGQGRAEGRGAGGAE